MPLVKNQFVYTMQETSIVGYLAIMDLTRAYSVVAARTMVAIVGLIVVTLAYFVTGSLIKALMSLLTRDKKGAAA
jgi:ABC-type amino acid transport system permease subunit